jgi:hypothetical protein
LNLSQVAGELEQVGDKQKPGIRVFGAINIFLENKMLVLEVRVICILYEFMFYSII